MQFSLACVNNSKMALLYKKNRIAIDKPKNKLDGDALFSKELKMATFGV